MCRWLGAVKALALIMVFLTPGALAQQAGQAGQAAREAAQTLARAAADLEDARGAKDRVRALSATLRAYEEGLEAMRAGLRTALSRERELRGSLEAREREIARLLGALSRLERAAKPQGLLHPQGALSGARAGMLVASITPALNDQARSLRAQLEEAQALREVQQSGAEALEEGMSSLRRARMELSAAIAKRGALPERFVADPIRVAILLTAVNTLDEFAALVGEISQGAVTAPQEQALPDKGELPMPVLGVVLRKSGQKDAAGIARPGLIIATRPGALVTAPAAATIRYNGPLLDYGLVSILEPRAGLLLVFAGLDQLYGRTGQVLPEGAAVGLMGGSGEEIISKERDSSGPALSETLYIEVREDGLAVDPMTWFNPQTRSRQGNE